MSGHVSANQVYRISWSQLDTERGLGPYGSTLHLSRAHAKTFFEANADTYVDSMIEPDADINKDTIPMVDVHSEVYMTLVEAGGSMWESVRVGK